MRLSPGWAVSGWAASGFAVSVSAAALALCVALGASVPARAASCTSQSEMISGDRDALALVAQRLAGAVLSQDLTTLQASLLPAVAPDWDGIRDAVQQAAPALKGGQVQLRSLYLLDASSQSSAADTQFFCSNQNGSMTVIISMRALPPGRYAVVLADAPGSALAGQMAFILAWDTNGWKLGGVFIRPGVLGGHDSVWYWQQARQMAQAGSPWAAYYLYEAARFLSLPVDFISSPNLDKLTQEQSQIKGSPGDAFPYSVTAGDRTWKIDAVRFDPSLREADLGATYESAGVTDPAAQRTEAIAVLGAFLKAQPTLRQAFHGMWAYAANGGKTTPVMELPMAQIP